MLDDVGLTLVLAAYCLIWCVFVFGSLMACRKAPPPPTTWRAVDHPGGELAVARA